LLAVDKPPLLGKRTGDDTCPRVYSLICGPENDCISAD
jgi:hypothetical protein